MYNIKTQFEIRYSTLINFSNEYKAIISPYIKLCQFSIDNVGTIEEYIVLTFKKEKYSIDCRWDKIIFIAEGDRTDLKEPQGPLFMFFEIFNKIKSLPTFGKIQNILLAEWNLKLSNFSLEKVRELLKEKYISVNVPNSIPNLNIDDFAVTCIYGDQNEKSYKISFGPFKNEHDLVRFNLAPISKKLPSEIQDKNGIFSESLYFEKASSVDFDSYKRTHKIISSYINEININE